MKDIALLDLKRRIPALDLESLIRKVTKVLGPPGGTCRVPAALVFFFPVMNPTKADAGRPTLRAVRRWAQGLGVPFGLDLYNAVPPLRERRCQ